MDKLLKIPIENVPMVGPIYAKRLKRLGIKNSLDLFYHFPFRYEDYSLFSTIAQTQPNEIVTIRARVFSINNEYTKRGKFIQKAVVFDNTGKMEIVWYNQPFILKNIEKGQEYQFSGKISFFANTKVMEVPEYETIINKRFDDFIHTGRLVPIYNETYGLSSKWLRSRIKSILTKYADLIEDFLPQEIKRQEKLLGLKEAIKIIHFPKNLKLSQMAKNRLSFDELFLVQLKAKQRRLMWKQNKKGYKFRVDNQKVKKLIDSLPFELTSAQKRAVDDILNDLNQVKPMNRLLEGDVGSGKTVVAALAAYVGFCNNYQIAFMAPTEILANQHYHTIRKVLKGIKCNISLRTANIKDDIKKSGIIIGTHALISDSMQFEKLGLVIIDEQHRFGVRQRGIIERKGRYPHVLTMTATPIPRTVTLVCFGDLDLSFLDELPKGRKRIKTWVVPNEKRQKAYDWIRSKVKKHTQQAFIICPLIEESETLNSIKAATTEYKRLSQKVFPDLKLALLHGRMKSLEKRKILTDFRNGKYDILIATPVVEVGIDIPKATIMVVEEAQRFGLAQLHQMRGRVGRSNLESYCLLFYQSSSIKVAKRLKAMEKIYIGAQLAELDLKLRGPGELYGFKQHGVADFKLANFSDKKLVESAQKAASSIITNDPYLNHNLQLKELCEDNVKYVSPN